MQATTTYSEAAPRSRRLTRSLRTAGSCETTGPRTAARRLAHSWDKAPTCGYDGALGGTRTPNLLIRSQMLYPLSYERRRCPVSVRPLGQWTFRSRSGTTCRILADRADQRGTWRYAAGATAGLSRRSTTRMRLNNRTYVRQGPWFSGERFMALRPLPRSRHHGRPASCAQRVWRNRRLPAATECSVPHSNRPLTPEPCRRSGCNAPGTLL